VLRRQRPSLAKPQLARRLRQIECDIAKIDAAVLETFDQNMHMRELLDILLKTSGMGSTTALMIFVGVPEIGALDGKQVACLVGLALLSKSSGKARVKGRHPDLRRAIFMPTLVVIRYNADLRAKCGKHLAAGKIERVAITAVERKMRVRANAYCAISVNG
jgi:transposase